MLDAISAGALTVGCIKIGFNEGARCPGRRRIRKRHA
jgi:hypothetical protein